MNHIVDHCHKVQKQSKYDTMTTITLATGQLQGITPYGHPTHPFADLFFVTKKGELILIHITGGTIEKVEEKMKHLDDWIQREQPSINLYTLKAVIFAPNIHVPPRRSIQSDIFVQYGADALGFLGGLQQLWRWLT
jgi:hypothetical protein